MPKILIGISILLFGLSAVFGFLNTGKVKALRTELSNTVIARNAAEAARLAKEKDLKARDASLAAAETKLTETQTRATNLEAQLAKTEGERTELQTKVQAFEAQLAQLQPTTQGGVVQEGAPPTSIPELTAQLDEARKQLDAAEKEKAVLADQIRAEAERKARAEEEDKRRRSPSVRAGLRGTVLAVNQAYNFVVLNLGAKQGVEPNSELLVLRDGSTVGKVVISSVEPATSIGDILTSSLARGVQVQPGDSVIYGGSSSPTP
jgi:hypothetical protein